MVSQSVILDLDAGDRVQGWIRQSRLSDLKSELGNI